MNDRAIGRRTFLSAAGAAALTAAGALDTGHGQQPVSTGTQPSKGQGSGKRGRLPYPHLRFAFSPI
jgi:hypothetical protein